MVPVRVVNFEDPEMTKPSHSIDVQAGHPILDEIKRQICDEENDPTLASIRAKFLEVERMPIKDEKKNGYTLQPSGR